jgi:hypothetical protein
VLVVALLVGGWLALILAGRNPLPFPDVGSPVMPAVRAPHPGEPVGQDAAPQIASEVVLHPPGDAPAHGIGVLACMMLRLGIRGEEAWMEWAEELDRVLERMEG